MDAEKLHTLSLIVNVVVSVLLLISFLQCRAAIQERKELSSQVVALIEERSKAILKRLDEARESKGKPC